MADTTTTTAKANGKDVAVTSTATPEASGSVASSLDSVMLKIAEKMGDIYNPFEVEETDSFKGIDSSHVADSKKVRDIQAEFNRIAKLAKTNFRMEFAPRPVNTVGSILNKAIGSGIKAQVNAENTALKKMIGEISTAYYNALRERKRQGKLTNEQYVKALDDFDLLMTNGKRVELS